MEEGGGWIGEGGHWTGAVLRKKSLSIHIPFLKMAWVYCNFTFKQPASVEAVINCKTLKWLYLN